MIPGSESFIEYKHIVTVEMNGMGRGTRIGEIDTEGAVATKVVDIPLGTIGVGVIALIGEEKDGLVVVCAEGRIVHCPLPVASGILSKFNVDLLGCGWVWIGSDRIPWCRLGERIVLADVCDGVIECSRGDSCGLKVRRAIIVGDCFRGGIASKPASRNGGSHPV